MAVRAPSEQILCHAYHRALCDKAARNGEYPSDMEKK